ncbi:MAG: O-antigen ligase family protein [Patescibacteria group bacterium]|nr:O-antigen ligase family protein [Patescibacteria group bacterium]
MFSLRREKAIKFCQTAIDWLSLSLIFLVPLYFAFFHELFSIFTLDKVVMLRTLVATAALIFLAKIFLAGNVSFRFGKRYLIFAGLLALSWLLSASFSAISSYGFWGYYPRLQGFLTLIFYLLFVVLLLFNLNNFSQVRRFIGAMLLSSLFACCYGLIQYFGFDPIRWAETSRIFSTFGQPNFFGHWLILVIPFTVYALVFWARRFLTRSLLGILLLGQLACLLFTYSRSAWLGLAAEIFLAVLFLLFLRGRKKIALSLIILSLAGLIFASSFFSFSPRPAVANYSLPSRLAAIFDFSQGTVRVRVETWQAALALFKEESVFRKLIGYGPDSLYEPFLRHYQASWALDENVDSWPDRSHNSFLDILLSFGLLGLAVYSLVFVFLAGQVWRFFKTGKRDENFRLAIVCVIALTGYFFNNLFSFSDTPQYLYFYLILGLLIFSLTRAREEKEISIGLTVFSRAAIFASFFILAAIFIFYFNARLILADYYYMQAALNVKDNNCPKALAANTAAIAWGGGNSLYYQNGYIANGLSCFNGLPAGAQEKLRDNLLFYLSRLPVDKFFYFAESKVDVSVLLANFDQAYYPQAEKDFAALAEKYPQVSTVYSNWANFEMIKGDYDKAIEVGNQGLATLPLKEMEQRGYFTHRPVIESWQIDFYDLIGDAYAGKKDWNNALSYYDRGVKLNPYYLPAYQKIAAVYAAKKDWDKAIWYNNKGYRLNPADYSWPLAIGHLYQEKGDKSAAIEYFQKVLRLNPDNKDAQSSIDSLKDQLE